MDWKVRTWLLGSGSLLVTMILSTWLICGHPWALSRQTQLDLNSGDLRYRVYAGRLPVSSRIFESSLSREARKVKVVIPPNRVWVTAFVRTRQKPEPDFAYGMLVVQFDSLIGLLDQTSAPDEERRAILTEFMTSMRTQDALDAQEKGYVLMVKLGIKYGVNSFTEDFVEQLKRSGQW
jgi:hypothetical protein